MESIELKREDIEVLNMNWGTRGGYSYMLDGTSHYRETFGSYNVKTGETIECTPEIKIKCFNDNYVVYKIIYDYKVYDNNEEFVCSTSCEDDYGYQGSDTIGSATNIKTPLFSYERIINSIHLTGIEIITNKGKYVYKSKDNESLFIKRYEKTNIQIKNERIKELERLSDPKEREKEKKKELRNDKINKISKVIGSIIFLLLIWCVSNLPLLIIIIGLMVLAFFDFINLIAHDPIVIVRLYRLCCKKSASILSLIIR